MKTHLLCWNLMSKMKISETRKPGTILAPFYVERTIDNLVVFLRGETGLLARLGSFQIRVGQQGSRELLSLLQNNEPNTGDERADNPRHKLIDLGIVPNMERFHGPVEKGYAFLQSFKTMTGGFNDNRKMQIFAGLLEGEALSWYFSTSFSL